MIVYDSERIGRWVTEKAGGRWQEGNTGIAIECDGKLVAGMYYDTWTGASIAMHSRVDDRTKVTREWLRQVFDYPFNQLKVKRVTGLVSSANTHAQRVNEKLGWIRETTLSDYFPDGNGIVYIMRASDCRWLRGQNELLKAA